MATTIDQKNFVKTALRLPPEVHAAIHEAAQASGRSYNAELVDRVQRSLKDDSSAVARERLETSLMGIQTMLAFHLQQFYDLLPANAKVKPINLAVKRLAASIGHGSADDIEETLKSYFATEGESKWFKAMALALQGRRDRLDAEVESDNSSGESLEETVHRLKADPDA